MECVMLRRFVRKTKAGFRRIFRRRDGIAGNDLKVYPDDVFIVSYPRSGNTWMRFLLGYLLFDRDISFDTMEEYVPDIYRNTNRKLEGLKRPRYLKSHEPFDERYPRVIYLVRDPRDVAISYYYWMLKFKRFEGAFPAFLEVFFDPCGTPYGRWDDHVKGWEEARASLDGRILFIRYEDLLADTLDTLIKVATFLRFPADQEKARDAIKRNDFASMRQKEEATASSNELFRATRKDISFMRKGQERQWETTLTPDEQERFFREFGSLMEALGYRRKSGREEFMLREDELCKSASSMAERYQML